MLFFPLLFILCRRCIVFPVVFLVLAGAASGAETDAAPEQQAPAPSQSLSAASGQQYHTVQIASFPEPAAAEERYRQLAKELPPAAQDALRIEKVGNFYSLRTGACTDAETARKLLDEVRRVAPGAMPLKAYIKPERIVKPQPVAGAVLPSVSPAEAPPAGKEARAAKTKPPAKAPAAAVSSPPAAAPPAPSARRGMLEQTGMPEPPLPWLRPVEQYANPAASGIIEEIIAKPPAAPGPSGEKQENGRAAPVPPPPNIVLQPEAGEYFSVRVGNFADEQMATRLHNRMVARLSDDLLDELRVEQADGGFAVLVGRYLSLDAARRALQEITAMTHSAVVVKAGGGKGGGVHYQEMEGGQGAGKKLTDETREQLRRKVTSAVKDQPKQAAAEALFSLNVAKVLTVDDVQEPLRFPGAVFYDPVADETFLINQGRGRIVVYGEDFFPENSLGPGRDLDSPLGGHVDREGRLFISQSAVGNGPARITILNPAFLPERTIPLQGFEGWEKFVPQRLAVTDDGKIYVVGNGVPGAVVFGTDGSFIKHLKITGKRGASKGRKEVGIPLVDVVRDSLGNLYFLSEDSGAVYVYNAKEEFLFSFGTKGGIPGKLSRPRGVAVDEEKRCFYVLDFMRHAVLVYDYEGTFRFEFGGMGWEPGWFNYPGCITMGRKGQVLVSDFFNNRVQVLEVTVNTPFPERNAALWRRGG